ncbi:MAG: hypothetical protein KGI89_00185 [Euryarchaeota archaeon]|nr:hypothetical protein [Euryarchaeota archaeon]
MRKGLVIVGVVLLALGAVLMFVPLIPSTISSTASNPSANGGMIGYNIYQSSFSLTGGTTGKFSFSSPSPVDIAVITCSRAVTTSQLQQATTSAQFNAACGTNTTYGTTQVGGFSFSNGTSGSFSVTIPSGGTLIWFALSGQNSPPTVTVTTTYTSPLLGLVLLVIGVLLLLLGVALKSKKQKQAATSLPPPQPWGPPSGQGVASPGAPPPAWQQPPPPSR